MPGANPICLQRIVTPIPVGLTLRQGGTVDVRVDVRAMFDLIDFATLTPDASGTYVIPDETSGAGGELFNGVTAISNFTIGSEQ